MSAEKNLNSQQIHLTSVDYDLRITNLGRFILSKITRQKPKANGKKLIDIGAGSGLMMKFFKSNGFLVDGIEYEKKYVEKMKADKGLSKSLITQGDITKIKGKEDYDFVVSADVIEHIEDHERAVKNLFSFVKPGGMMIVAVPAHQYLYSQRDRDWGHYRRYSKSLLSSTIKNALKDEKYEIKFLTFWNFIGFWTYLFFVKLVHLNFHEKMRYENQKKSSSGLIKKFIDWWLRQEAKIGGLPIGLTLVVGVEKK